MENKIIKEAGPQVSEAPTMVFNIGVSAFTVDILFSHDIKDHKTNKINRMIRREIQGD